MKAKRSLRYISLMLIWIVSCQNEQHNIKFEPLTFDLVKAEYLYQFAYECIDREYPYKPGLVLGDISYLKAPREHHPSFYGCFDWHSAVHGHWTLVTLLSEFPGFEYRDQIIDKLKANITEENVLAEMLVFQDEHNKTFQRTYGWAWLLKLDEALREWDHPVAMELHKNLQPLSDTIAVKFIEFLDILNYPIRVGEHPNTAFGMSLAYDYAEKYNPELAMKIAQKAKEYFTADENCPLMWEPGGFDFLSPCLQEASIMLKVLPRNEFSAWLGKFLPGFERNPTMHLTPAEVPDASDGKLAHLDGLNFSRAWCLFEMGKALNNQDMLQLGLDHFNYSYVKMDTEEYAGAHWLASFATYALLKGKFQSGTNDY